MLRLEKIAVYYGPNPWALAQVVVCQVSDTAPGTSDVALRAARAAVWARAALNEVRGFLHEGGARDLGDGRAALWVEFHVPEITVEAIRLAVNLLNGAPGLETRIQRLRATCREQHPDYQARILMTGARAIGIPVLPLARGSRLYQYGWGQASRLFFESASNGDGFLAGKIAQSKSLTKSVLLELGVPTPRHRLVDDAANLPGAADEVGRPCVVKPVDRGGGKGVTAGLTTDDEIAAAFAIARQFSSASIMVESFVPGDDHRLMVVDGRLVAAIRRDPPSVSGDGTSTVRELVAALNSNRTLDMVTSNYLRPLAIDEVMTAQLAHQRMALESVPPAGQRVTLRSNANLSTGGICTDVTADVHPEVRGMAVMIANTLGFATLGLDYITTDIRQPLARGGAFIEVNTTPGLDAAIAAGQRPEDVAALLLGTAARRIPAVMLLVGDDALADCGSQLEAEAVRTTGLGWLCDGRAGLSDLPLTVEHLRPTERVACLLRNRLARAVVVIWGLNQLRRNGVPFDRLDTLLVGPAAIPPAWQRVLGRVSTRVLRHENLATLVVQAVKIAQVGVKSDDARASVANV